MYEKRIDDKQEVIQRIRFWSNYYGVDYNYSKDIAFCESSFRKDVYGDNGKAYSVYQFHKPTFNQFTKELGKDLDYYDWDDNIRLANWAFSKGYSNHWTCAYELQTQKKT